MEDGTSILYVLLIILVGLSSFFSFYEATYSRFSKIRLTNYVKEKRRGSKRELYLLENFDKTLSTVLVGKTIVNIATAIISTKLAVDLFGESTGLLVSILFVTIFILIFGEILPKSFDKEYSEKLSLSLSGVLYLLTLILAPITILFVKMKEGLNKVLGSSTKVTSVTEEKIKDLLDLSEEEGAIDADEKELLNRSLEFNDIVVGEILTPRIDIQGVKIDDSIENIKDLFLKERFSRIPVYEGTIDNIIGILYEREFLCELVENKEVNVRDLLRKPILVTEGTKISNLMKKLQENKNHMAIVVDEYGGTAGLVTLEDILEQLVGEIWDEYDEKEKRILEISEDNYEFDADVSLDEFMRILNIEIPDGVYYSLGGWIVDKFERIPRQGEKFIYKNLSITISEVRKRRLRKVIVKANSDEFKEAEKVIV